MPEPRYDLADKVVLITGAGGGLGSRLAGVLTQRGARVALLDIDFDAAQRAASVLDEQRVIALAGDVTDLTSMRDAVQRIIGAFGHLDVAVANAGVLGRGATFRNLTTTEIDRVLAINVMGAVNTAAAAMEAVIERRGQIVMISSVYAFVNGAGALPYAMSKAAVAQLGRGLAAELAPHGASALTAYFSLLNTDMIGNGVDAHPEVSELLSLTPKYFLKRIDPTIAATAIADGLETRAQLIVTPRRWRSLFAMQGIAGPLIDNKNARNPAMRAALTKLDNRDLPPGIQPAPSADSTPTTKSKSIRMSNVTDRVSARLTNLVAQRFPAVGRRSTESHVAAYRSSGGRKRNTLVGRPVFLLDVVGRSSGQARPVMLMYVPRGDDLIVVGSGGGSATTPNWYKNLMAAPTADVQVGNDRWTVTARELDAGAERDECWALATTAYAGYDSYQTFTDRTIPVAVLTRHSA